VMSNRRVLVVLLLLVGSFAGVLGVWEVQAYSMKREFIRVMLGEGVENAPPLMREKVWTESELRGARVVRVPRSAGMEQALVRAVHVRGSGIVTDPRYGFQAAVTDSATGIRHVYGRLRDRPGVWVYDSIHPDSTTIYIQQREQLIPQYQKKTE